MDEEIRRTCRRCFSGDLDVTLATSRLKDIVKGRRDASLSLSCTLFALWDLCDHDAPEATRLADLSEELIRTGALDEDVWLSSAEWDLLEASRTVTNVADDKRREVRYYTRVVYVQTRFNLLSECPTGFARLISIIQRSTSEAAGKLRGDLCRLVGALKIEPHRVADLLLEFLPTSVHPSHELMTLFDRTKVGHYLGRKLQMKSDDPSSDDVDRRPDKLLRTTHRGDDLRVAKDHATRDHRRYYRLCAALEVQGALDMSVVFPYLHPTISETKKRIQECLKTLRAAAREQRFPNLNRPLPEARSRVTEKDKDVHYVYRDPKKFAYHPERVWELIQSSSTTEDPFVRLAAAFMETSKPGKGLRLWRSLGDAFGSEITEASLSVVDQFIDPFYVRLNVRTMAGFVEEITASKFGSLKRVPAVYEWLRVTGYRLHQRMEIFRKVALVLMHEVKFYGHSFYPASSRYPSPNPNSVEAMLSTVLLPSLLLMDPKTGLEASAWIQGLLSMCSYSVRIMVCIHFEEVVKASAVLDRCVAMAETTTKNLIKILVTAQDTEAFETIVIPIADAFGQLAIRAPYHVTQTMVQKVQTDVMAAKDLSMAMLYFTPLAFSTFSHHFVLEIISTGSKKHDEGRIVQWYKNMLTYLGHVAHDHPEMLSLHFILQNILKEIAAAEVIHIHILRELVHSMTGFEHCSEIGNSQFATLSGGPMLKSIGLFTPWQKDEAGYNASAVALKHALSLPSRNDASVEGCVLTLGGQMFVLLMKFLDYVPIRGDFGSVASVMEMHSTVLGTFLAAVEFLSAYCTAFEYAEMLPPLGYVINELQLPVHYVAHLYRPSIAEMRVHAGPKVDPQPSRPETLLRLEEMLSRLQTMHAESDVESVNQLKRTLDRAGLDKIDPEVYKKYKLGYVHSFYDFVEALSTSEAFKRTGVWEVMSPEFYTFFWSLRLNDITISDTEYKKQTSQMQEEIDSAEQRSETEISRLKHKLDMLKMERELQQTHVKFCRVFIRSRQEDLLSKIPTEKLRSFVDAFVQLCLYPRIRLGHEDALFAFEFVVIMTKMGVQNFPTLFILDKVVKELFPCLICMTDNEAEGFANFMYEFLRQMERWRSNTALFSKEFGLLPGALEEPYTMGSTALVTHDNFLKVMAKWSNVIARLLKECLQPPEAEEGGSGEGDSVKHRRIMRRPALLLLVRLIPIFPTLTPLAKHLLAALQYVKDHDQDEGMKTSAFTALSRLKAEMESNKPGRWLELDAYNIKKDPDPPETHEMQRMEISDVMEIESNQGTVPDTQPIHDTQPIEDPLEDEEELILGGHKEEGELEKASHKTRRRSSEDSGALPQRSSNRKRPVGRSDAVAEGSVQEPTRRASTREDTKRKRELASRAEGEKERKPRQTRRDDARRKS